MFKIIYSISIAILISNSLVKAQSCVPGYCSNGGVCVINNGAPVCQCRDGFTGSKCQLKDPCTSRPCGSNGACFPVVQTVSGSNVETVNTYCQCYSGFSGSNCQYAGPRPCSSRPCLNNGVCVEKPNSWDYTCDCVAPYSGTNCGTYTDYCANNKCQNEAVCVPLVNTKNYTCQCQSGYFGAYCEQEINECEIVVNEQITSPCKNNATCYDLIDGYFCSCTGPFIGQNCETQINPCQSNPCGPGTVCTVNAGSYVCSCQPGYFGSPCQPDPCVSNPCKKPGSRCLPIEAGSILINVPGCVLPASYVCICPGNLPEYASQLC